MSSAAAAAAAELLQCLSLLRSCRSPTHLRQAHAHAAKCGLDSDPLVAGKLLFLAAVSFPDALDHAVLLLSSFPSPDGFMHNTLIRGLSDSPDPRRALLAYADMGRSSVAPDSFTFSFALKGAANYRSLSAGRQVHSHAILHGFDSHLFVSTTLVSMYGECGCPDYARKVFDGIPHPNAVTWNAVLTACFRADDLSGMEGVFGRMPWPNSTSWNVMLAGYTKAAEMSSAKRLFVEMPERDPVSWSTMITGFAGNGSFDETFRFFRELLRSGVPPNEASLTGALSSCSQSGAFEFGKVLHGYMEKSGFSLVVSISNALLDMYSKCGSVAMSRRVFEFMTDRKNIVSWTSMIAALAMHGHGKEAIGVFRRMQDSGTQPDAITFISVLYACSHSGLVDEGYSNFCSMEEKYGIEPSVEHYGCIVDLYGRAGLLEKAYEFVKEMPMTATAVIWRTLLGACSIHGNVELAEHVNEHLSELEPNNSGDNVLLSNIYSVAGKWTDAANIRGLMSKQRMQKTPGWSSIELDKTMYLFVANDEPNGPKEEAHRKLAEIMLRLRFEGYVPETLSVLHDIEEEEKQDAISRHSEKLAVAFGIARVCPGSQIRVVKNLRVCRDCHAVMKLISKVYETEIVLRDRSRFHLFRHGSCSCGDYW